jgi:hypothetical protein
MSRFGITLTLSPMVELCRWHTSPDFIRRHVLCHNTASSNHRPVADRDTRKNCHASAQPDTIPQSNTKPIHSQRLLNDWEVQVNPVICSNQRTELRDETIIADLNGRVSRRPKIVMLADPRIIADTDVTESSDVIPETQNRPLRHSCFTRFQTRTAVTNCNNALLNHQPGMFSHNQLTQSDVSHQFDKGRMTFRMPQYGERSQELL